MHPSSMKIPLPTPKTIVCICKKDTTLLALTLMIQIRSFELTDTLLWFCRRFPLIDLIQSFGSTDSFLWFYKLSPLLILNFFFDFTESSSPQRKYGEPSPSQRRRLAKSMTNLRQLVEFKGAFQSIHKCASKNPIKRFSKVEKKRKKSRFSTDFIIIFFMFALLLK